MPSDRFGVLRGALRKQGVADGYAQRLVTELREHCCDLESERLAAGDAPAEAIWHARRALGTDAAIVGQVLARPELRGRWTGLRAALRPLQRAAASAGAQWPDAPAAGPTIARWSASIGLATALTGAMLLALARTVVTGA